MIKYCALTSDVWSYRLKLGYYFSFYNECSTKKDVIQQNRFLLKKTMNNYCGDIQMW